VSKPCQDRFLHPVLVIYRKNTGSQMGHTKKRFKKKKFGREIQIVFLNCSKMNFLKKNVYNIYNNALIYKISKYQFPNK